MRISFRSRRSTACLDKSNFSKLSRVLIALDYQVLGLMSQVFSSFIDFVALTQNHEIIFFGTSSQIYVKGQLLFALNMETLDVGVSG